MEVEEAQEPVLGPAPGPAEVDTAALAKYDYVIKVYQHKFANDIPANHAYSGIDWVHTHQKTISL